MVYQWNFKINQSKKLLSIGNLLEPQKIYPLEFKQYKNMINTLTRINKSK